MIIAKNTFVYKYIYSGVIDRQQSINFLDCAFDARTAYNPNREIKGTNFSLGSSFAANIAGAGRSYSEDFPLPTPRLHTLGVVSPSDLCLVPAYKSCLIFTAAGGGNVAIAIFGFVAAWMAIRAEHKWPIVEKVLWVGIALTFLFVELNSIYKERDSHDREQAELRI